MHNYSAKREQKLQVNTLPYTFLRSPVPAILHRDSVEFDMFHSRFSRSFPPYWKMQANPEDKPGAENSAKAGLLSRGLGYVSEKAHQAGESVRENVGSLRSTKSEPEQEIEQQGSEEEREGTSTLKSKVKRSLDRVKGKFGEIRGQSQEEEAAEERGRDLQFE